jgi:DNA-binding NarL/FixJ family response regulator
MSLTIFLVEDEPALRKQLVDLVQAFLDADVIGWADTEQDALTWLHAHPNTWHFAIVDIHLAEGTGFGVLSNFTEAHKGKVVMLTNSATTANRTRCLQLGADAVFDKSAELEEFIEYCSNVNLNQ